MMVFMGTMPMMVMVMVMTIVAMVMTVALGLLRCQGRIDCHCLLRQQIGNVGIGPCRCHR